MALIRSQQIRFEAPLAITGSEGNIVIDSSGSATIARNLIVSGTLFLVNPFSGSVVTSSYSISSSYALSSSQAVSSSYTINAATASYVNPLTQSVLITGSFSVVGPQNIAGNLTITGSSSNSLLVKGSGATSATTAFLVQNNAGQDAINVKDDLTTIIGQPTFGVKIHQQTISSTQWCAISGDGISLPTTTHYGFFVNTNGNYSGLNGAQGVELRLFGTTRLQVAFNTGNIIIQNAGTFTDIASARLQVTSTTQGFLPPRTNLTSNISSPVQGLQTYLTGSTNEGLYYYNSGSYQGWTKVLNNSGSQNIAGNLTITGSLIVTEGITGSFSGSGNITSASYALSSSYALTASYLQGSITSASYALSSSYATTASYVQNAQTASYVLNAVSSSFATTASFALNAGGGGSTNTGSLLTTASVNLNTITFTKGDGSTFPITVNTGSGGGSGSAFPYTGSAGISGSLNVNGPLNVDVQSFNIDNDTFTQNATFNSSSINLNTISNQLGTLNREWISSYLFFPPSSITSGSTFQIDGFLNNPSIGTKVFYSGSQSDSYGIPNYKFLGIVTDTGSDNTGGEEPTYYNYAIVRAYITTSSLGEQTYRFYNTGSGLGSINLNGYTNINGAFYSPLYLISGSEFRGSLVLNGTASINNNLQIISTLINRNNNPDPNRYTGSQKFITLGQMDPTVGSGSWSSNLYSDTNFITLVRNPYEGNTSFDPYAGLNTRIQFQQGTRWNYTIGEDTYTNTINNTTNKIDFTTDNVYGNIIEMRYVGQGYNTQANEENAPLLPAKGFHTNYNGTAYFNVTGSISASSYYGNGATLTGITSNPLTGSFLVSGSVIVNGTISSSIANLNTINSTNGINSVYISEGSGSRTTNLVIGDPNALLTLSGTGTSGQNLIAIGSGSLISATSTFRNIALGNNIMPLVTTNGSNNNIGIGYDVFTAGTTSLTNNIAIGNSASYATTTGDNNIAIGTEALFSNATNNNNIAIGLRAGKLATGAVASIFIGTDAGANVTSGDNNIAIGFEALKLLTTVNNNIAIGYQAMVSGSGAADSIAIGANTLSKITTGDFNLAIGANALGTITTANGNLAIGTSAMVSSSATLASNNTTIGYQSLQQITGSNNVSIGYNTMQSFRSGSNNTVIGYNNVSGSGISGSNNTIVGGNIVLPDGAYNNRIIIADGQGNQRITVSGSTTSISGSLSVTGSAAIFTLQPQSPLPTVGIPTGSFAVSSSIPAKPFFWDGSVWNALY